MNDFVADLNSADIVLNLNTLISNAFGRFDDTFPGSALRAIDLLRVAKVYYMRKSSGTFAGYGVHLMDITKLQRVLRIPEISNEFMAQHGFQKVELIGFRSNIHDPKNWWWFHPLILPGVDVDVDEMMYVVSRVSVDLNGRPPFVARLIALSRCEFQCAYFPRSLMSDGQTVAADTRTICFDSIIPKRALYDATRLMFLDDIEEFKRRLAQSHFMRRSQDTVERSRLFNKEIWRLTDFSFITDSYSDMMIPHLRTMAYFQELWRDALTSGGNRRRWAQMSGL
jgi:hypothetical protein